MKKYLISLLWLCAASHAGEVYKWKDEQGQIHFGDRQPAGAAGETIGLKASAGGPTQSVEEIAAKAKLMAEENAARTRRMNPRGPELPENQTQVPDSQVPPQCLSLIDAVNNSKPGPDSKAKSEAFVKACPGIARACRTYRTHQKDSYCMWVKQHGNEPISHLVESD
ncbi:uncharacterized protein DUF4124 [Fluviicoccus keumensis]|uniref:Uncharacterized protein DUF4124 n=1 Tax=Fluviicoccus keumensis TaxID=1435465 RepID=A0A4Q7YPD0_9GAMM|nr:DUF4124 domain-containing protein [Fluviicoccus keumensis]RZU38555.1 uncharacterized protein DUF4124 [Fluviicoccus keumensis]